MLSGMMVEAIGAQEHRCIQLWLAREGKLTLAVHTGWEFMHLI